MRASRSKDDNTGKVNAVQSQASQGLTAIARQALMSVKSSLFSNLP
jgi:hypothetical protein